MKIASARVVPIALPLRAPLAHARGAIGSRAGALLVLESEDGRRGLGEATPIAGFGLESAARARIALAELARLAIGGDPRDVELWLQSASRAAPDAPCARAAFEGALCDLTAQGEGLALAAWLARSAGGSARAAVPAAALLAGEAPDALAGSARRARAAGFRCVKLKLGAGRLADDLRRVAAVREWIGPDAALRLDANEIWPDARTALAALERLAELAYEVVELVEQPVPGANVDALAQVRAASPIRIAADEAVAGPGGLERVLAARAADAIVLKPAALGGLRAALRAGKRAREAGCAIYVTSLLDGAVSRAAALAVASALPDPLLACGLATGALLAADLAGPERVERGAIAAPRAPGLGVALDPAALARVQDGPALEVTA